MKYTILFLAIVIVMKFFFRSNIKKCKIKLALWPYKLFYTDEKRGSEKNIIQSKLLVSEKYNLSGKPDLVYKNIFTQNLIPIELKSGKLGNKNFPRHADLLQLVAYFIILEDYFKIKPRYGKLIYSDCAFIIRNKKKLREEIFSSLKNMRVMLKTGYYPHQKNCAVCKNCICNNSVCEK